MKKITFLLAGLLLTMASIHINAAEIDENQQECTVEYNLYKGDIQAKNYAKAKTRLLNLMENCPTLSVNIYKYGIKIADNLVKNGQKEEGIKLYSEIIDTRIIHFQDNLGKVYSDMVTFLSKSGYTNEEVFVHLEKAYKADPSAMSAKNTLLYFDMILSKFKDTNVQKILDNYDDINESLDEKSGKYQKRLSGFIGKEESGSTLSAKEAKSKRIAEGTLKNIGIVIVALEQRVEELLTCDRLIPLYKNEFKEHTTDAIWLRRAVSRMFTKECTEDPLYEEIAEAYAHADPSSTSFIFLSGILEKNGKTKEAFDMREKAIELEVDPVRKAQRLLTIAQDMSKRGQKSKARRYAYDALKSNPSYGSAYLLIASLYATSANSCGNDEFAKRMVYVAALNKAERATLVDPSIYSKAKKYIDNYKANIPTKAMGFADGIKEGDSFKVGCWIGETIKVRMR
jgi:tetratricopeptide (TPR) repeat protein